MWTSIASSTNRSAVLRPHRDSSLRRSRSAAQFLSGRRVGDGVLGSVRRATTFASECTSDPRSFLGREPTVRLPEFLPGAVERRARGLELTLKLKRERSRLGELIAKNLNLGVVRKRAHGRLRRALTVAFARGAIPADASIDRAANASPRASAAIRSAAGSPTAIALSAPTKVVTRLSRAAASSAEFSNDIEGTPGRTRTCDPRLRRPLLYPSELRARVARRI